MQECCRMFEPCPICDIDEPTGLDMLRDLCGQSIRENFSGAPSILYQ